MSNKLYTDYPFIELGDTPQEIAPVREVQLVSYDQNKYCVIVVEGVQTEIKAGYIYTQRGRLGDVPTIDPTDPKYYQNNKPQFVVSVAEMVESHRTTYWVCLDKSDRSTDAKPWDDGRITPFKHENKQYADAEARVWANFLGVGVTDNE